MTISSRRQERMKKIIRNKMDLGEIIDQYGDTRMGFVSFDKLRFIYTGNKGNDEVMVYIGDEADSIYHFKAERNMTLKELKNYIYVLYINDKEVWQMYKESRFGGIKHDNK